MTQQLGNSHLSSQPRKTMEPHTSRFYKLRPTNKSRYCGDEVNVFDLHSGVQKVIAVLLTDFYPINIKNNPNVEIKLQIVTLKVQTSTNLPQVLGASF